jgi:predicted porin
VAVAAALPAVALAQSSVTLSGNLDFAVANYGGQQAWAKGTTVTTLAGTSSTTVINIRAEEKLDGGLKLTAHYGLDPRSLLNDSLAVTNNNNVAVDPGTIPNGGGTGDVKTIATVGGQANTATGLARDEAFVGIEGPFGNVRLGSPNSIGLNSFLVSSPLGTGIGSGYTGAGTAGTVTNSYVQTRYNRSLRWDSPVVNGFSAAILYAPGNDLVATTTGLVTQ